MFCSKCGARLEEGSLFCGNCGNKVGANATTESKNVHINMNQQNQSQMNGYNEMPSPTNQSQGAPTGNVPIQGVPISNNQNQGEPTGNVPNQSAPVTTNQSQGTSTGNAPIQSAPVSTNQSQGAPTGNAPIQGVPVTNNQSQEAPLVNIPIKSVSTQTNQNQGGTTGFIPKQGVPISMNQSQGGTTGFIPKQGVPNQNNQSQGTANGYVPNPEYQAPNNGNQATPKKKEMSQKNMKILCGITTAVVGIMAFIAAFIWVQGNKKETVNLHDYCKVEFSGNDTDGTAELSFDYSKFEIDILKLEGVSSEEIDEFVDDLWTDLQEYKVVLDLIDTYDVSLDKQDKLKNGDTVKIKVTVDEEAANKLGYNLIGGMQEVKVEGLTPIKEIDPFASIRVEFTGVSPDVTAEVINDSDDDFINSLYFECDKKFDLKKGDKVTISVDCDENYALSMGYRVTKTSQTYECTDVDYYANQISDLNEKNMKGILEQSKNVLVAYFAEYSEKIKAGELKYEGYYLLNLKNNDTSWGNTNRVVTLYSTEVTSLEKEFEPTKVYFPLEFGNIIMKKDGTVEVERPASGRLDILGKTDLVFSYRALEGYTDIKKLYEGVITKNIGKYDYAMTDGLKKLHGEK